MLKKNDIYQFQFCHSSLQLTTLLEDLKNDNNIDVEDKRAIELYYKRIMDILCIPKDEYVAFKRLCDESFDAWILAKSKANYSIFEPYLKRVIESKKKLYGYRNSDKSIYNQMLDDFEPGMSVEKYDIFFEALKNRLVPLIKKVTNAKQIKEDFLHQSFPVEEQKSLWMSSLSTCILILHGDIKMNRSIRLHHGLVRMTVV